MLLYATAGMLRLYTLQRWGKRIDPEKQDLCVHLDNFFLLEGASTAS